VLQNSVYKTDCTSVSPEQTIHEGVEVPAAGLAVSERILALPRAVTQLDVVFTQLINLWAQIAVEDPKPGDGQRACPGVCAVASGAFHHLGNEPMCSHSCDRFAEACHGHRVARVVICHHVPSSSTLSIFR
jgi:hypothetical protein